MGGLIVKIRGQWFDPTPLGMSYSAVRYFFDRDRGPQTIYGLEQAANDLRRIAQEMGKMRQSYKEDYDIADQIVYTDHTPKRSCEGMPISFLRNIHAEGRKGYMNVARLKRRWLVSSRPLSGL
jgi:hypothetical protein